MIPPENDLVPVIHYPTMPSQPLPIDKHVRFLGRYKNYDLQKKFNVKEYGKDDLNSHAPANNYNPNNQNLSDEDTIFHALKDMIILEEHLSAEKSRIQNPESFPFNNIYELFDDNSSGQIVLKEFVIGSKALDLKNITNEDASLLMRRISRDGNLKLSFEEFKKIFFDETNLHSTKVSRRSVKNPTERDYKLASDILKTHLNVEVSCEEIRKRLNQKGFDLKRAFQYIDENKSGLVTKKEFYNYLQHKNFNPNEVAFTNFYMKMDRNGSGSVNAAEFAYELEPKTRHK